MSCSRTEHSASGGPQSQIKQSTTEPQCSSFNPLNSDGFSSTDKYNLGWACSLYILKGNRFKF